MKQRLINLTVSTIVAVAAIVFLHTLLRATVLVPEGQGTADAAVIESASSSAPARAPVPARLRIPSVGIDAKVQRVGLTASGAMGTPSNFTDVAWYARGARPGDRGTAYIDGHVDNGLGLAGVFKRLDEVKVGDDVYVAGADDATTEHFIVTGIEAYEYDAPETKAIFEDAGDGPYIKLITCGGKWVPEKRTYDHRLVVTAKLAAR